MARCTLRFCRCEYLISQKKQRDRGIEGVVGSIEDTWVPDPELRYNS